MTDATLIGDTGATGGTAAAADASAAAAAEAAKAGGTIAGATDGVALTQQAIDAKAATDAKAAADAKTAADAKAATDAAAKTAADKAAADAAAKVVPEKYADFKLPDGVKLEGKDLEELSADAKALGLTQDQAQKFVEREMKIKGEGVQAQAAQLEKIRGEWADATKGDAVIGGDKLPATLAAAKTGLAAAMKGADIPEFGKMLDATGFGNHPQVIRLFAWLGGQVGQDSKFVGGKAPGNNTDAARAARMYPSMKTA